MSEDAIKFHKITQDSELGQELSQYAQEQYDINIQNPAHWKQNDAVMMSELIEKKASMSGGIKVPDYVDAPVIKESKYEKPKETECQR